LANYTIHTSLAFIAAEAVAKESENEAFTSFLKNADDSKHIDAIVHQLNNEISPAIDCTTCGNCCKSLMINVTEAELQHLSAALDQPAESIREKYLEQGLGNEYVINTIPCHFLSDNKCTIYEHRFQGCRDFPHLHQDNFTRRLFSMFMHYGTCPIIYNVMEQLKKRTRFIETMER
jgi:Fe-S-cluster containining protein